MTDATDNDSCTETSLIYADRLPLAWTPQDDAPDAALLARLNRDNLQVLQAVGALEEYTAEPTDDDATAHALARLDLKVALLLDLVGKLLMDRAAMPAPVPVELGSRHLAWRSDAALAAGVGDAGVAAIYLRASPATPLIFVGNIASVHEQGAERRFELAFSGLDEPVRDALEKLIFRHHRRSIAHRHPSR